MRALGHGGAFHLEGARGVTPTSPSSHSNGTERSARSTAAGANHAGAEGENEDDARTAVASSPVGVRRAAKRDDDDDMGENGGGPFASRSAEKSSRHTSAWDKILVVPSPTVSLAPQVPEWFAPAEPLGSHDPPSWGSFGVKSAHRSSPMPAVPPKPVRGDSSDSDEDWTGTKPAF
jgi:hypothetical protein